MIMRLRMAKPMSQPGREPNSGAEDGALAKALSRARHCIQGDHARERSCSREAVQRLDAFERNGAFR